MLDHFHVYVSMPLVYSPFFCGLSFGSGKLEASLITPTVVNQL
jgi:hypothetical protein